MTKVYNNESERTPAIELAQHQNCQGNSHTVRCVLNMETMVATRPNPVIRDFYQCLLSRGRLKELPFWPV